MEDRHGAITDSHPDPHPHSFPSHRKSAEKTELLAKNRAEETAIITEEETIRDSRTKPFIENFHFNHHRKYKTMSTASRDKTGFKFWMESL